MKLKDFPIQAYDKVRYADTDALGHVNNAVFSTFLEAGRAEVLYNLKQAHAEYDYSFVVASVKMDFVNEITWPGKVEIGTAAKRIGNSSVVLVQMLYQHDVCTAKAETVLVQINNKKKGSAPISDKTKEKLNRWLVSVEL